MHVLLFPYRLPQLKAKSTKVLLKVPVTIAPKLGYPLPPVQESTVSKTRLIPKSSTFLALGGKPRAKGAELANQHCHQQPKALSPYIHTFYSTYVQLQL